MCLIKVLEGAGREKRNISNIGINNSWDISRNKER